jgi:hypothetical protein
MGGYNDVPRGIAAGLRQYDQRVSNAIGGNGFRTDEELGATSAHTVLCFGGQCWNAGDRIYIGNGTPTGTGSDLDFTVAFTGMSLVGGLEFTFERGGYWKGNGNWYPKTWGGNQWTGGKLSALANARAFKLFGRVAFYAGAANTLYQYHVDNISGTKAVFDIGFGAVGTFGGAYGFAANVVYTGVDMTVGWPVVGRTVFNCDANCQYRANHYGMFAK